jgi:hypothetical protein
MKSTSPLRTAAWLLAIFSILASCSKEQSSGSSTGPATIKIFLTDHQTPVFDSVFIDLQKLEVRMEDNTSDQGWINLSIQPGVYNILKFRNGLDTVFANGSVPSGSIRKIRLTLGSQNSVMRNGQSFPLRIKDQDQQQVVINISDDDMDRLEPGKLVSWLDFDAGNSIRIDNSGGANNSEFELRPKIKLFTKSNTGSIEGKILPENARAVVMAIQGADTATAIPENHEGEFKIMGLAAGNYKLFIEGQNGFLDSTINNVVVRRGEDTHLPAVVLHQ